MYDRQYRSDVQVLYFNIHLAENIKYAPKPSTKTPNPAFILLFTLSPYSYFLSNVPSKSSKLATWIAASYFVLTKLELA